MDNVYQIEKARGKRRDRTKEEIIKKGFPEVVAEYIIRESQLPRFFINPKVLEYSQKDKE